MPHKLVNSTRRVIRAALVGGMLFTGCAGKPERSPDAAATPAAVRLDDVRERVMRAVGANDGYFTHYCIAVDESAASGPGSPDFLPCPNTEVDASPALLDRLRDLDAPAVPASACNRVAGADSVAHRATNVEPALFVALGPIEIVSAQKVRLAVLTDAGFLTATCTLYELQSRGQSEWEIAVEKILLQG